MIDLAWWGILCCCGACVVGMVRVRVSLLHYRISYHTRTPVIDMHSNDLDNLL